MAVGLTGEIKAGDAVKTLNRKQAVYGRVVSINRKRLATVKGRTQPGAPEQTVVAHVENLDLVTADELCGG
jgi:hypothetical protein